MIEAKMKRMFDTVKRELKTMFDVAINDILAPSYTDVRAAMELAYKSGDVDGAIRTIVYGVTMNLLQMKLEDILPEDVRKRLRKVIQNKDS